MACRTVNQTGTSCSRRNVSRAASRWRRATGGSRRSTITTTVSASTARCAKRTSKDRASSPREGGHSARCTHANPVMYNSDTVYSTTTFRPVSPAPPASPARSPHTSHPSPQRTRKLETPLHFDGGLFSDITTADGTKLLSKVTVDKVSTTSHDVTNSPHVMRSITPTNRDYVDELVKTETTTNEDVFKVKFTPVLPDIEVPRLLTPSQFTRSPTPSQFARSPTPAQVTHSPVRFLKDNFEDLQSYKIVNSICKDNNFDSYKIREKSTDSLDVTKPVARPHSPLANLTVSEQLTKIDNYLQKSLDVCAGKNAKIIPVDSTDNYKFKKGNTSSLESTFTETKMEKVDHHNIFVNDSAKVNGRTCTNETKLNGETSFIDKETLSYEYRSSRPEQVKYNDNDYRKRNSNSVKETNQGVLRAIYNMPIHYHAAILCFILIIYNLVYQYIKQNCHGKIK